MQKGIRAGKYRPKDPPCKPLIEREDTVLIIKKYFKDSLQNMGRAADRKFPLLGTSGMKGIGKSALLWHCVRVVVPDVVKELAGQKGEQEPGVRARGAYLTFNGYGNIGGDFGEASRAQGSPSYQHYGNAFWSAVLASCGVDISVAMKLRFQQSLKLYRQMLNMSEAESLVLMVDEVGMLDAGADQSKTSPVTLLLSALMGEMDGADGKLVFLFSHIRQEALDDLQTDSGRRVLPLPLPGLPIDAWAREPVERGKTLLEAATQNPSLHQLLLSCCGHPRSLFEGIDEALDTIPLLSDPSEMDLDRARDIIMRVCKFGEFSQEFMRETAPKWFDPLETLNAVKLARDGLLLTVKNKGARKGAENKVDLFLPLLLHWWAATDWKNSALAYHLHKAYMSDAMLGNGAEKKMEAVLYHYEAVLRAALKGKEFTLKDFYRSDNIGPTFVNMKVRARMPDDEAEDKLVCTVADFKNGTQLLELLKKGFIVVSCFHSEPGIEYLSPFTTRNGDLIVAAVQCKFITGQAEWGEISDKAHTAMGYLRGMGIECFPVVYTNSDQKFMKARTYQHGVYFTARDLFKFTNRLGILRLHIEKLGKALRTTYPWLNRAAIT